MFLDSILNNQGFSMGMSLMGFLMMIPIVIALFQERRIRQTETKLLIFTVFCHTIVCLANFHSWMFEGHAEYITGIKICDTMAFTCAMIGLFCFMNYEIFLLQKRTYISDWVVYLIAFVCGATAIIMIIGMHQPEPWFISYDSNGNTCYTDYYYILYLFSILVMIFGVALTWSCRNVVSNTELLSFIGYIIFPIIGGIIDVFTDSSFVYPLSSIMLLMLYANIHTNSMRQAAINEKELTQSKAKLMVSQIQPHFMYNALNSIYYLIEIDPERAQEAVSTFSDYLRQNVNSLRNDAPVLFSQELGHTKAYLSLEKLRFGRKLEIEYNINAQDFVIPALSIQPLVENAVKHGVTQKEDGGTVSISTKDCGDEYVISISDNGVGFKAGELRDNQAHSHVGIENVRSRLETMVCGKLLVDSVPGKGTVCTVIIPKENQPKKITSHTA